jgi:hypothetical protein
MKKYLLWFSIITLGFISCQQEDNTPPSNPTSTMTATEQAFVGKWYWDSIRVYNAGSYTATYDHSYPYTTFCAGCFFDLRTSFFNGITNTPYQPQMYDCVYDKSMCPIGTSGTSLWQIIPPVPNGPQLNKLYSAGMSDGYIRSITSTNLVVSEWGGNTPQGYEIYYHKQ